MKHVTIVYEITDEAAWQNAGKPLRFDGLIAHTVAFCDAVEQRNRLCDALVQLLGVVGKEDFQIISDLLNEISNHQ